MQVSFGCFYRFIASISQVLLWIGLVRLHIDLKREDIYWEECIGKIRSAYIRKLGREEELDALQKSNYAPIVNRLVAVNFAEIESSITERCLLLRQNAQDGLCSYLVRWLRLLFMFLMVAVSIGNSAVLLWIWLLYAVWLAQKQVIIYRGLERVQQSLLLPHRDYDLH